MLIDVIEVSLPLKELLYIPSKVGQECSSGINLAEPQIPKNSSVPVSQLEQIFFVEQSCQNANAFRITTFPEETTCPR